KCQSAHGIVLPFAQFATRSRLMQVEELLLEARVELGILGKPGFGPRLEPEIDQRLGLRKRRCLHVCVYRPMALALMPPAMPILDLGKSSSRTRTSLSGMPVVSKPTLLRAAIRAFRCSSVRPSMTSTTNITPGVPNCPAFK